ncbi:MAG: phospholipase [Gemmatimonadaceae bacterium]
MLDLDYFAIDRRRFLTQIAGIAAGAALTVACNNDEAPKEQFTLSAKPKSVPMTYTAGSHAEVAGGMNFQTYVPASALTRSVVPIMIVLHGANKGVDSLMSLHRASADAAGVIVVAPISADFTWDAIHTRFGVDVSGIDSVLKFLFDRIPTDWSKVVLSGFSDGATYAIGLGRANGNLFSKIVSYSPGFILDCPPVGRPPIVISHGTADGVLPYSYTQGTIVPTLIAAGYPVDFQSFDGNHQVNVPTMQAEMTKLGA